MVNYKWDEIVYAAIVLYKMEHDGNMPTYGEMEDMTGAVRSMIFQSIQRLCEVRRLYVVDKKVCVTRAEWEYFGDVEADSYEGSETSSAPATSFTTPSKEK